MSMQNCGMNSRNSSKEKKSSNDQVKPFKLKYQY